MKRVLIILLACTDLLVSWSGCAQGREWAILGSPEDYFFKQSQEGLTVAVDPWNRSEDMAAAFKKNLLSRGILPVRIALFNDGRTSIRFSSTQAKLRLPGGTLLSSLPVSRISEEIDQNEAGAAFVVTILTAGYGSFIGSAIANSVAKDNWEAQSRVRKATLDLVTLDPGHALVGFLFYDYSACKEVCGDQLSDLDLVIQRMPRSQGSPLCITVHFILNEEEILHDSKRKQNRQP